ncbi:flagellar hook-length control protein FliK [Litchfieldella rifensis]|uniref:Flagellar hook-length control protein FliK n=1 Tax=Litchfieldella rifensis TaxID=762643 RepID=A0ABV7LSL3_9GAMM
MSGITPILDTLLHQVLGKRVDIPVSRPLNEPVKPLNPADALRAVRSDSRLDARQPPLAPLSGVAAREVPRQGASLPAQGSAPPSTSTHFSPAATTIADILVKFPAPPSVIKPVSPLMPLPEAAPSTSLLASRLQASISESGVFYESHLNKWFRGELPRQALEHEPQMWRTRMLRSLPREPVLVGPFRPAPTPLPPAPWMPSAAGGTTIMVGGTTSPSPRDTILSGAGSATREPGRAATATTATTTLAAPPMSGDARSTVTSSAPGASPSSITTSMPPATSAELPVTSLPDDSVSDALQGIVRHQLEMLVTPVLRWEGDVWSGIFMALMIHVPEETFSQRQAPQQEAGGDEEGQSESAWHSELTLKVESLGTIGVSLRLEDRRLALTLTTESTSAVMHLERGQAVLRERLEHCGLDDVALRVNLAVAEGNAL